MENCFAIIVNAKLRFLPFVVHARGCILDTIFHSHAINVMKFATVNCSVKISCATQISKLSHLTARGGFSAPSLFRLLTDFLSTLLIHVHSLVRWQSVKILSWNLHKLGTLNPQKAHVRRNVEIFNFNLMCLNYSIWICHLSHSMFWSSTLSCAPSTALMSLLACSCCRQFNHWE